MAKIFITDPRDLPKGDLVDIVRRLQVLMYGVDDEEGYLTWDPDKETHGSELVEGVAEALNLHGLTPGRRRMKDWTPKPWGQD